MAPIIPMVACTLALSLLSSCTRSAAPASAPAAPVIDASPRRQVDWLPADASLVVYLDGKVLRASDLYESFAPLLPAHDPPLREALDRLDSLRIAAVMRGTEPALVGLFQGDFDDAMNPSLLTQESAHRVQRDGRDVIVRDASRDHWFRTPEGFWIVCEESLWSSVAPAPEARPTRLGDQAWATPPTSGAVLYMAAEMTPLWREQLATQLVDPMATAMIMPVVEEARSAALSVHLRRASLDLRLHGDFASGRGAQAAAFLLQAGVMAARAQAAGVELPGEPQSDPSELAAAERVGRFLAGLLDGLDVVVSDSGVDASLTIQEEELSSLRMALSPAP